MKHFYEDIGGWFCFDNIYREVVRRYPSGSHFVEIGSWLGKSASYMAVEILNSKKDIKFDCVDTWEYWDDQGETHLAFGNLYSHFLNNIKPVEDVINPIKLLSVEAAELYENESLDFIFLDASHDYESVKEDLNVWYPKLKKTGIIAGHDYTSHPGVKKAVDEFFAQDIETESAIVYSGFSPVLVSNERSWLVATSDYGDLLRRGVCDYNGNFLKEIK